MKADVVLRCPVAEVRVGGLVAHVQSPVIRLGHMGCKLLGTLPKEFKARKVPFPEQVARDWDQRFGTRSAWAKTDQACARLGAALAGTLQLAGCTAVELWDTMRNGSDAWRPGGFVTRAVGDLHSQRPGTRVTYLRHDELCPSSGLLQEFRESQAMAFGDYAARYAAELGRGGGVEEAVAAVVRAQAAGALPLFYCVDPYIPGDGQAPTMLGPVEYGKRQWLAGLRDEGCHRVVLAEEVARRFREHGFAVELYEVDQLCAAGAHVRRFG
jgi:hypothetical protein